MREITTQFRLGQSDFRPLQAAALPAGYHGEGLSLEIITMRALSAAVAGFALLFAFVTSASAQPSTCAFKPSSRIKTISSDTALSNVNGMFTTLPESTVSFVQGGTQPSCVMVQFFGTTRANQTGLYLQAAIDQDSINVRPDSPQIARYSDAFPHSETVIFVIPDVPPGAHKITFKFRTSTNGQQVAIGAHNVAVTYAP